MSDFDIEGARKAGYSDAEIADHLGKLRSFDVGAARSAGYSDADILKHLGTQPAAPANTAAPKTVGAAMAVQTPPRIEDAPQVGPGPRTGTMPEVQPTWGDVAADAVRNLPGSFVRDVVRPTYEAFRDRPAETLQAIPKVIVGAFEHLPQPKGKGRNPRVNALRAEAKEAAAAVGRDFVDAYGSEAAIKNTLANHPARALLDVSTLGTAGATLPGRAGQIAGRVASLTDPVSVGGNVLRLGSKGAGSLAANTLGATTGTGTDAVRAAARAGREGGEAATAFRQNMRGDVPLVDVVNQAKSAVEQLRTIRTEAYKKGMGDVSKDKTVLDFTPIEEALGKANEVGTYKGVVVNRSAGDTVGKINALVDEWKKLDPAEYHTPEGLDALKRTIGDLRDSTEHGTPARVAADRVYNAVKAEIQKQAPVYAKVMEDYSKASEQLKEVTKTFSLGEKASDDTALRKLQSTTRNNVQTNYGERQKLLEALAELEPTLPYAIAGQSMNALLPRGVVPRAGAMVTGGSMVGNPTNILALPFFSPRIVGELAYGGGRIAGGVADAANALRLTPENVRRAGVTAAQSGRMSEAEARARLLRLANENALAR